MRISHVNLINNTTNILGNNRLLWIHDNYVCLPPCYIS